MRNGMRHYISPDERDVLRKFVVDLDNLCEADHRMLGLLARRLDEQIEQQSTEAIREVRRVTSVDVDEDYLAVDDDAEVLEVENGHWVQAWLWVQKDEASINNNMDEQT